VAAQKQRGSNNAAPGSERAALLAERESLVKTHDRLRLTPANDPAHAAHRERRRIHTGAYDSISYVGATERPTSSGLNTGLWGRNERTQTPRWSDKWNDAVRHGPSAVNERCHVRTSGDASARFATSRAIIRRRTIAVAHWNGAET
jgi:hypothetical protein